MGNGQYMTLESQFLLSISQDDLRQIHPYLFRNIQRSPRSKSDVLREFDREKYRIVQQGGPLSRDTSIDIEDNKRYKYFDGQSFREDLYSNIKDHYELKIASKLAEFLIPVNSVVDIGCGSGDLLRSIFSTNQGKIFYGLDISLNALQLLLAKADSMNVNVLEFDVNNVEPGVLAFTKDSLIYTSYLMMYSNTEILFFLSEVLDSKPKYIIFIEPLTSHFTDLGVWGEWCAEYFRYHRYNDEWFISLNQLLPDYPEYSITKLEKHIFAHNPLLPVSLLILERS